MFKYSLDFAEIPVFKQKVQNSDSAVCKAHLSQSFQLNEAISKT